jgi:hypothetical protein
MMDIPSSQVHDVLARNGVVTLNHAASVSAACHYLRAGALLSRGTVARKGLYQTPQTSDAEDKKRSVWFDVFVDSVDIHGRGSLANIYGPVLFVLDASLVSKAYTGRVWVTKSNPIRWAGKSSKERWFQSQADLEMNFVKGRFDQMVVFRHCGGELEFGPYLKEIILDDPIQKATGVDFYSMAYGALLSAARAGGISVKVKKRKCGVGCKCGAYYATNAANTVTMFLP